MSPIARVLTAVLLSTSAFASPVIVEGLPVAPGPTQQAGQGFCVSAASSTNPSTDFPTAPSEFVDEMNAFLDAHSASALHFVQATALDLSTLAPGDFENAVSGCSAGGCAFPWTDTTTSFGARFRAFLSVPAEWVGQEVHFGFFNDDAVAFRIFDADLKPHDVVVRPPTLGAPAWRITESVRFSEAGLYPVEVLHAQITEGAALELSVFIGDFVDFERRVNEEPIVSLSAAGFTLLDPSRLYLTASGRAPFADASSCLPCERAAAGSANSSCPEGYHCNAAALCSPCESDAFCGESCAPCTGQTPFCTAGDPGFFCAECRTDADCSPDQSCDGTSCVARPDASDAGNDPAPEPDAGTAVDAGTTTDGGGDAPGVQEPSGCGCTSASGSALLIAPVAMLLLATRRRRRG